jgi:uncharacterized repeat protein (TIGR03803 family)
LLDGYVRNVDSTWHSTLDRSRRTDAETEWGWSFSEFQGPSRAKGIFADGSVREDGAGNLYGTAEAGGTDSAGVIFKLTPASGGGWTESVIHIFDDTHGAYPVGLIEDGKGGFYGSALEGANSTCNGGCGVVYDLVPGPNGGWVENILHHFSGGYDGGNPSRLYVDANGNIFGVAEVGGSTVCQGGCGTVFEISAPAPAEK